MIKPLLRVIPGLSGNVKLACNIMEYKRTRDWDKTEVFETDIRYAKLLPLASNMFQKKIDAGLLGSSYEFDLKKFYDTYADDFYNDCFIYDKDNMLKLDLTVDQMLRNTDFEFGVKRISYIKNEAQFAFFAPIFIESVDDIPSHFIINVKLRNGVYDINKKIKVNIANNGDNATNYLARYLNRYAERIDNNVAMCQPRTNQIIYFGIDLQNGGFVKTRDSVAERIYKMHNTIHNFDATIVQGFKRNHMCMKQIIPLCFYFNVNDILTSQERFRYTFNDIIISGSYFDRNNNELPFYDFSIDYDHLSHDVLQMSEEDGLLRYSDGAVENIMDVGYPSLNESRYVNYRYANKLTANFCRWKMKFSDDEHPYIMNMSWAFSNNQKSNYKYGEFPVSFYQLEALADYIEDNDTMNYNIIFPLSDNKKEYDRYNKRIASDYANTINQYCLNWFEVVKQVDDSIFANSELWKDCDNGNVYYNGILYDLNNLYQEKEDGKKIDKFAVIVEPELEILSVSELDKLKFTNATVYRQVGSHVTDSNAVVNDSILDMHFNGTSYGNYLFADEEISYNALTTDEIALNKIFTYAYADGNYVDLKDIGLDFYELNRYYDSSEIIKSINYINKRYNNIETEGSYFTKAYYDIYTNPEKYVINGYLQLPIYRSILLAYDKSYDASYSTLINSSIINTGGYENIPQYLKDNLYVHSLDNAQNEFYSAYHMEEYNGETFGYLTVMNTQYNDVTNGNTFYVSHKFFKNSYIQSSRDAFDPEYLRSYINAKRRDDLSVNELEFSYWNFDDISNPAYWDKNGNVTEPTAYACYLYKECNEHKQYVGQKLCAYIENKSSIDEYQFNPIMDNNGEAYVTNVFTAIDSITGRFYGDFIPAEDVDKDMNVLWADIYNLARVFEKNGYRFEKTPTKVKDFYVRFLNKQHIYYYYVEMFRDENYKYKDYSVEIWTDRLRGNAAGMPLGTDPYGFSSFEKEYAPDYTDWFINDWFTTIFIKKKIWIYDEDFNSTPKVQLIYENIGEKDDFMTWYNRIGYDESSDLFFYIDKPDELFEICFRRSMYRVDEALWNITDIENLINDKYRDIYFYRIQEPREYDTKYYDDLKIDFYSNKNLLSGYDIQEADTCLIPMFDSIFAEDEDSAAIVVHYMLHNINKTWNDYDKTYNYRYNKNDKLMLMEITDEEREQYGITKTYKEYDTCKSSLDLKYDELGYGNWHLNTKEVDGVNYGFYLIKSHINNTANTFRITGIVKDEYLYNIKYIYYINYVNIGENPEYIVDIYKELSPFMALKPIQLMTNIKTIIYPMSYRIPLQYSQSPVAKDADEVMISMFKKNNKVLTLQRYMHAMTPLLQRTTQIQNEYRLKLKNVDATLIDTGELPSKGDFIMYKYNASLNAYDPANVYSISNDTKEVAHYNNKVYEVEPVEYKHYNCNKLVNLKEQFKVATNKKWKYADLLEAQKKEAVVEVFRNYISKMSGRTFADYEVLFLLNKYNVSFDSVSVGLTLNKEEKLYSLTYVFDLL